MRVLAAKRSACLGMETALLHPKQAVAADM